MSSDLFDPDSAITRAMFVTVLYRMDGQPAVDQKAGFTDVAEGSYYAAAVDWAAKNGIVNGVSETSFDPDAPSPASRWQRSCIAMPPIGSLT